MAFPIKRSDIDWRDYWRLLVRRRWFFVVPAASIFLVIFLWSLTLPRVYRADTLIRVEEEKMINPLIKDLAVSTSVRSRLDTLREEILSWPRIVELVTKLDMAKKIRSKLAFENLVEDIRRRIEVKMKGEELITISFEDRHPAVAQKVVQTITDVFIEANLMSQTEESRVAIDFVTRQLGVYEGKLEHSEKLKTLYEIHVRLEELERDRTIIVEQMSGQRKVVVAEVMTQANPVMVHLRERLAGLEMELTDALVDSTEAHPRVIMLRRDIAETKARLSQESESIVASEKSTTNPIYQALEERLKSMEVEILALHAKEKELKEVIGIDTGEKIAQHDLATAERNNRVNEQIYAMLLNKLETAHITERLEASKQGTRFEIIEPPRLPLKPIKPERLKIIFMGLLLALGCGAGCVVLAETFDHTVRTAEEARAMLKLSFLGAIPKIVTDEDRTQARLKREEELRRIISAIPFIGRRLQMLEKFIHV
ncbi:MAG: hypothetical protein HYY14_02720 [Candidatus Omnitrophica bacterium]|nr:hypothetical protein [Candidatus Omnitrophota bacterium]